jgi:hypothetical protein
MVPSEPGPAGRAVIPAPPVPPAAVPVLAGSGGTAPGHALPRPDCRFPGRHRLVSDTAAAVASRAPKMRR